jgi:glycosyltransferase involved in cell wall biosynthesis
MRAINLANALAAAGHRVVLWSSVFYHQEKRHRFYDSDRIKISPLVEIRLISSPGYIRNIGFARLWDHFVLAFNLRRLLKNEDSPPDVAFIGYPPIEAASVMATWLKKRGVPFFLDIKDLWPLVFLEAVPISLRPLGRIILAPYFLIAKACIRKATGVGSMADSFLDRSLLFADRRRTLADGVFPLTTPSESVDMLDLAGARSWWAVRGVQKDQKFRVCYVGNLSSNVDLTPIKEAAVYFAKKQLPVEFIICGDGVSLETFKKMMHGLTNVSFPGRINRQQVLALSHCCQASLIPYVNTENFQLSLPNKTLDSLSLGLPILSPLMGEVEALITSQNVGFCYGNEGKKSLVECVEELMLNAELQQQMSKNAVVLHEQKFSFACVYEGLVKHLEVLAQRGRAQ